ncbi:hypothetical protein L1F30_11760 [Simiduia sp. 21SJ11W-1]|uniref:hypothetical protein n=1 Tax=Simiduia sp. 21SJ11W-1 TaxID=2909669 RepID=UPI00209D85D1|nr:hypothetical protein [Simiduia sp. 21SJ11W-1]UTA46836.1 hypothetical protein L1F30_11760 [Simiduia sp. 21SJ11W-1]
MFNINPQQAIRTQDYISPYSIEYSNGRYVIYWLTKILSSHASLREAESAVMGLSAAA